MQEAVETVQSFLANWKPFAELGRGHPARRSITRLVATEDQDERRDILARVNKLFQLQGIYLQLGIRKEIGADKSARFARLFTLSTRQMAAAIKNKEAHDLLVLLQDCFEFGRSPLEPKIAATRQFLLELWKVEVGGVSIKYSIYANGVLFSLKGASHDEMAKHFVELGLGSGRPMGGGQILRTEELTFLFDTASTAFGSNLKPAFVIEAVNRWLRLTGGDEGKVKFTYQKRLKIQ